MVYKVEKMCFVLHRKRSEKTPDFVSNLKLKATSISRRKGKDLNRNLNRNLDRHHTQHHRHDDKPKSSKPQRRNPKKEKKALSTWKQYTDRLMYMKQRYPTEYIDRNRGWIKWSEALNSIEAAGTIDTSEAAACWKYIDFARLSLGTYSNYLWVPSTFKVKRNRRQIEWNKKYIILMDFNLFLFDTRPSPEPMNIKQTLCHQHSVLSLATIRRVGPSKGDRRGFRLDLSNGKCIEFRCDDSKLRDNWIEEMEYQMKCIQDLLKIPNIKLKAADPDSTIWVPLPSGVSTDP